GNDIIADFSATFTAITGIEVDPPAITVKPFAPMSIPPPVVTIEPAAPVTMPPPTITVPEPEVKTDWVGVGKIPENIATSLTDTIEAHDWAATGTTMGNTIVDAWDASVAGIGALLTWNAMVNEAVHQWDLAMTDIGTQIAA